MMNEKFVKVRSGNGKQLEAYGQDIREILEEEHQLDLGCFNSLKDGEIKQFGDFEITKRMGNIVLRKYLGKEKRVVIPEGIIKIGKEAFKKCNITEIFCPSTLLTIGKAAFYGCQQLKNVSFNEGLLYIGDKAFKYCSSLTSITLPTNLWCLDWEAFAYCTSLTHLYTASPKKTLWMMSRDRFVGTSLDPYNKNKK